MTAAIEGLTPRLPTDGRRRVRLRRRSREERAETSSWGAGVAAVVLVLLVLSAVLAPWLSPYDPLANDLSAPLRPPVFMHDGSAAHLLGTDSFGRDLGTRLLYGARVSLLVVALSLLIGVTIGAAVGLLAGYLGGWVDVVLMRVVDVMLALPSLLVALVAAVALGPSLTNLVLIIGFLTWPNIARLIRGEALTLRDREFVVYARAIGVSQGRILVRHILPNVLPTLLVASTLEVANVILTEASLSFLGAGLPPTQPSWGVIIEDGRALVSTGWWISVFAGLAITVTVLSFNRVGDWLRDRLDPRAARSLT